MNEPCCLACGIKMTKVEIGANVGIMAKVVPNRPYQVFSADIHQCGGCGARVAAQFADKPFWLHFHDDPVPVIAYAIWEK